MNVMTNRTKAILLNCVLVVTLLALLHFYPLYAVVAAGAMLLSVGNIVLIVKAREKRRNSARRTDN